MVDVNDIGLPTLSFCLFDYFFCCLFGCWQVGNPISFTSTIVICCHPISSFVIQNVIHCHPLSSNVIHCHLLSSIVILCQPMPSNVIHCHPLSSIVIRFRKQTHFFFSPHRNSHKVIVFCFFTFDIK